MRACTIDGCRKPHKAHGLCANHYARLRLHGSATGGGRSLADRGAPMAWLEAHVDYDGDGCLPWPFYRDKDGYAVQGRHRASRTMCELRNGPPASPNLVAAHNCGKGHEGCVHPKHLRWATQQENIDDKKHHGTGNAGEKHNLAKLTTLQVAEIRRMRGALTQGDVARLYGISKSNVGMIQRGQTWRDAAAN